MLHPVLDCFSVEYFTYIAKKNKQIYILACNFIFTCAGYKQNMHMIQIICHILFKYFSMILLHLRFGEPSVQCRQVLKIYLTKTNVFFKDLLTML